MTKIIIPVKPVPKGRPRFTRKGHTYTPKKTADFEKLVAFYTKQRIKKPLEGALNMEIIINKRPPKSWSKKKQYAAMSGEIFPAVKPDVDNYAKSIKDGMEGIAFKNDSQVVKLNIEKRYSDVDNAEIDITEVSETYATP